MFWKSQYIKTTNNKNISKQDKKPIVANNIINNSNNITQVDKPLCSPKNSNIEDVKRFRYYLAIGSGAPYFWYPINNVWRITLGGMTWGYPGGICFFFPNASRRN